MYMYKNVESLYSVHVAQKVKCCHLTDHLILVCGDLFLEFIFLTAGVSSFRHSLLNSLL